MNSPLIGLLFGFVCLAIASTQAMRPTSALATVSIIGFVFCLILVLSDKARQWAQGYQETNQIEEGEDQWNS